MLKYKELLKPGDVLFTFKKGNWFSKLIWIITRKKETDPKVSHTVLYLGDDIIIENAILKGVKLGVIRHYNEKDYEVKVNRIKDLTSEEFLKLKKIAISKVEKQKYSYIQILLSLFKKIFKIKKIGDYSEKESICNEFIIDLFKDIGYDIVPGKDSASTTPLETYQSKIWVNIK